MNRYDLIEALNTEVTKNNVQQASTIIHDIKAWMIRFTDNKITVSKNWRTIEYVVYLLKDNKSFGFKSSELQAESIKNLFAKAMKYIQFAPKQKAELSLNKVPSRFVKDDSVYNTEILELTYNSNNIIEEALTAAKQEGAPKSSGTLTFGQINKLISTTTGCEGETQSTFYEFSMRAFYDETSTGQSIRSGSSLHNFDPSEMGREAGRTAFLAQKPHQGKPGTYQVFFSPYSFANIIDNLSGATSAYQSEIGLSCLKGKVGKKLSSDFFNLTDHPRNPESPNFSLFDDEGYPTKEVPIIKNGVFSTFLHSQKTAQNQGAKHTSSSYFSSSLGDMIPSPISVNVCEGDMTDEELLEEVETGIFVNNVWYTRFQNYLKGDFSTIPRDGLFLIKKGKISHAIRGLRLNDNLLRLLSHIRGLSKKRIWVKWWEVSIPVLTSSCLVDGVKLTKSTK